MENEIEEQKQFSLEKIIETALIIPGVKVDRDIFLKSKFSDYPGIDMNSLLENGPVTYGIPRENLSAIADKLIRKRVTESSAASFAAGLPGGVAAFATVPADVAQFFGIALRLAQEISYIYGAKDLWQDNQLDGELVQNQLIMYCGVMFGVAGAGAGMRVLSVRVATNIAKKLPQKALTKQFWYRIVKKIGNMLGIKVVKSGVAKGLSKIVPVVGGVVSGAMTFATMTPMAKKLKNALDKANFDYSDEELEADITEIENDDEKETNAVVDKAKSVFGNVKSKMSEGANNVKTGISNIVSKKNAKKNSDNAIDSLKKLAELKDSGIISQEEFDIKKSELMEKI